LLSALHPSLIVGTRYWVAVGAGLTNTVAWNLNTTGDVSDQAISTDNGATWFSPSGNTPGALEVLQHFRHLSQTGFSATRLRVPASRVLAARTALYPAGFNMTA
jgi:hypothetical protein